MILCEWDGGPWLWLCAKEGGRGRKSLHFRSEETRRKQESGRAPINSYQRAYRACSVTSIEPTTPFVMIVKKLSRNCQERGQRNIWYTFGDSKTHVRSASPSCQTKRQARLTV